MNDTLRVKQDENDRLIPVSRFAWLHAGDYIGDGMHHGNGEWSWTRCRVVANDTRAKIIVVRFPNGEYSAGEWGEFDGMYVKWSTVCDRPAIEITGETWAA